MKIVFITLFFSSLLGFMANAIESLGKFRPKSAQQLVPAEPVVDREDMEEIEDDFKNFFKKGDCESIISSVASNEYETLSPDALAVLAYCEPPGKDPEKMFAFAEKRAPENDAVLLLHARYLWRKQRPGVGALFSKLLKETKNPRIRALAEHYVTGQESVREIKESDVRYSTTGFVGGIQQTNPEVLAISNSDFGKNVSTAGTAAFGLGLSHPVGTFLLSADYFLHDTTYWRTHDVDLLTQDFDLPIEKVLSDHYVAGLRPYTSLYLLNGIQYYSANGIGVTLRGDFSSVSYWSQISYYRDDYFTTQTSAQSGNHFRFDLYSALKDHPSLQPKLFLYVDQASAGVESTTLRSIPYSHMEYAVGFSFFRSIHRYGVGLSARSVYREDSDSTRLTDTSGQTVEKQRKDVEVVVQPSMTVPLIRGLDIFLFFESKSISSNFRRTDGLDRNVSDNTAGALLRFSGLSF